MAAELERALLLCSHGGKWELLRINFIAFSYLRSNNISRELWYCAQIFRCNYETLTLTSSYQELRGYNLMEGLMNLPDEMTNPAKRVRLSIDTNNISFPINNLHRPSK